MGVVVLELCYCDTMGIFYILLICGACLGALAFIIALCVICKGCGNSRNYENRDLERQKYGDGIQRHNNLERQNINHSFQQHSASNKYVKERQESHPKPFPHLQDQQTSTRSLATYQNENEILKPRPAPTGPNKQGRSLLNK